MDNNQRGQQKKQQGEGISNVFIVVTHFMALKHLKVPSRRPILTQINKVKSPITYLGQAIILVNNMSGCDNIHTIDDVISYIITNNTINVPVLPDYSGKRVNNYYKRVLACILKQD